MEGDALRKTGTYAPVGDIVTCDGEQWWSCYGEEMDISAPGVVLYYADLEDIGAVGFNPDSHNPEDLTDRFYSKYGNGTSSATPQVTAIAALMLSVNPNLTVSDIRAILQNTADKVGGYNYNWNPSMPGHSKELGYGRVDTYQAVLLALAYANKSVDQTATANNNSRKLVKDASGNYHLVFASGGEIFYRKSVGGTSWQSPVRLSSGNGENNYPCITLHNTGDIFVTWQRKTGTGTYDIYFTMSRNNGAAWDPADTYILTNVTSNYNPLPVIQADYNGYQKVIAFKTETLLRSYITTTRYPGTGNWVCPVIINSNVISPALTDEAYTSPTITPIVYQYYTGSSIYYKYHNGTSWGSQINLSVIVPGSGIHETPSITNVPGSPQLHIAWKKTIGSGSTPYDHLIIHRKSTNYNTWPNEWFGTYYQMQESPSITGLATNKVDLLFQTPPQFGDSYIYRMRFNGSTWGSPIYIANSARYPSVSSGSTTAKYGLDI